MNLTPLGKPSNKIRPEPFEITRGSHGLEESIESGDYYDPKNKADHIYSGELVGELRTPPYISNYNDGISFDGSSKMEVEGRVAKHWTKTKQELDFTVKDTDDEANLSVSVHRDFSGHGRLEIRNRGEIGGDGQINFPLGSLSKYATSGTSLSYEHQGADLVKFSKNSEMARVEVHNEDGTKVYVAKDGMLYREEA